MNILLVFPPQWTPNSPYLALPLLAAQLKKCGHNVKIADLNIEFFNEILTEKNLKKCLDTSKAVFSELKNKVEKHYSEAVKNFNTYTVSEQTMLLKYKRMTEVLFGKIPPEKTVKNAENAVKVFKSKEDFYNPETLFSAKKVIAEALKIASLPFAPNEIIYDNYFCNPLLKYDWVNIDDQCKDENVNMFIDFFKRKTEKIKNENYDLVCISVPDLSQLIPSFTLSRIIKEQTDLCVAIGGNYITQNKADFMNHPEIFGKYCDFLMVGEGEKSITEFAEYSEDKRKVEDVSNLIWFNGKEVICNQRPAEISFNEIATPDFSGIDFSKYFSPETVLPMQLSKGCYWGKCTFCDYYYGQQCYSTKKIDDVIAEIKHYIALYGVKHFLFIDEAIPPVYYNNLSDAIIDNGLEIYFYSFVRLEKGFTKEVLKNMHKAGFRIGLWGYEAKSERIMKMMNKGIDTEERLRILKDAHDAGIWNNALFIMGYPTETKDEIDSTIETIYKNRTIIDSCTPSNFSLKKNAILMDFIGTNGLLGFETNGEFYTVLKDKIEGLPQDERRTIRRNFHTDYLKENEHCLWPVNYSDTDHILLYMAKYGLDYVAGYRSKGNICIEFR